MGTLADTLGQCKMVPVGDMKVSVKPLSVNQMFDCLCEAFKSFEDLGKPIHEAAQEAIETGKIPLPSLSLLMKAACKDLDDDDISVLLSGSNMPHAIKIAAVAMGNEIEQDATAADAPKDGAEKNG
jgi:hypothetical protein